MTILFYLIPVFFLTLLPSVWKKHLDLHNKGKNKEQEENNRIWNAKEKAKEAKFKKIMFIVEQVARFLVGCLYAWLVIYVRLIDISFGAFFMWSAFIIAILLVIDGLRYEFFKIMSVGIALFVIWFACVIVVSSEFTKAGLLFSIIDAKVTEKKLDEIDIKHIRFVPLEYAKYKGDKLYSEIPNFYWYEIGEYSLQKIKNSLYWVAPIEFAGYWKYNQANVTPGYIIVSAEDKDADAKLVKDYKMKYTPSSYFGTNLERLVRSQYPDLIISHASFEPDDNGKPFYAVSYGHYEAFRSALVIDGIVLVDAETGEMKKYTKEKAPSFLDQIIPESVALDYSINYGNYAGGGWWNAMTTQNGVTKPTAWGEGQEIAGVFVNDQLYYFTDHTTTKNSGSMVGYVLMNARSGEFTFHKTTDSLMNGNSALSVVNNSFKSQQWHGTMPILYNIYGVETWVVPVLDNNHLFREVALVEAKTGTIVHNTDEQQAYDDYKGVIASIKEGKIDPTKTSEVKEVTGVVKRFAIVPMKDKTVVKILLVDNKKIFTADVTTVPISSFIHEGDTVKIKFIDTNEDNVSVKELSDESLK
jgi:hypothetical protein